MITVMDLIIYVLREKNNVSINYCFLVHLDLFVQQAKALAEFLQKIPRIKRTTNGMI